MNIFIDNTITILGVIKEGRLLNLMIREKLDVLRILHQNIEEIKKKFTVRKIGIFGSYARGEETEKSDIDLLVEFENPTFDNFMDLLFFLKELFGRDVDLVTKKALSPYIFPVVEREVVWCE